MVRDKTSTPTTAKPTSKGIKITPKQLSAERNLRPRSNSLNSLSLSESSLSFNESSVSSTSKGSSTSKRVKKSECPCGVSSGDTEWLLVCIDCAQYWHACCANLKGTQKLEQESITEINRHWLCPWCFKPPFLAKRPKNHASRLNETALEEQALTCSVLQKISDTVANTISSSIPSTEISDMKGQIEELKYKVESLGALTAQAKPAALSAPHPNHVSKPPIEIDPPEPPFSDFKEDILKDVEATNILKFLQEEYSSGKFANESGHSVLLYGESYSYTGSKTNPKPEKIPPKLSKIAEDISSALKLKHAPNSVLINHFPACNPSSSQCSHLAKHCDDEPEIVPDSKIITISLGSTRRVTFHSMHQKNDNTTELLLPNNSVYAMTRSSQAWYKHCVPAIQEGECAERFSITFRTIDPNHKRSIIIVGDSNTKDIAFGKGTGKLGDKYPGQRIKAAKVEHIDPVKCIGYQNIIITCGTNNLRCEYIKNESDIRNVASELCNKLTQLKQICPKAKIFVMPVLPSRIHAMNKNIRFFNMLVDEMLAKQFHDIWFKGLYEFLDRQNLLDINLTRNGDSIHLGPKGIARYVSILKRCIFHREKIEQYSSKQGSTHDKVGSTEPT